jgi:hypothetical protein
MADITPEQRLSTLIAAIDHELDTHGPQSLADVIVTLIENRWDSDEPKHADDFWRAAAKAFEQASANIPGRVPK